MRSSGSCRPNPESRASRTTAMAIARARIGSSPIGGADAPPPHRAAPAPPPRGPPARAAHAPAPGPAAAELVPPRPNPPYHPA